MLHTSKESLKNNWNPPKKGKVILHTASENDDLTTSNEGRKLSALF
jgi:hypothetical protein